jgi:hypothetical protein
VLDVESRFARRDYRRAMAAQLASLSLRSVGRFFHLSVEVPASLLVPLVGN